MVKPFSCEFKGKIVNNHFLYIDGAGFLAAKKHWLGVYLVAGV